VEAFGAPAVALIETPIFRAPAFAAAPGAKQSRIVITDDDGLVSAPFREAICLERAPRAVLGSGVEESTVLQRAFGTQDTPLRAFQNVVLGIVAETPQWNARADRFGLGWDDGIDAALFERCIDLGVGIAGVGSHGFRANAGSPAYLVDLRLDEIAFVGLSRRDLDIEYNAHFVVDSRVLLVGWLQPPIAGVRRHRGLRIGHTDLLVLAALGPPFLGVNFSFGGVRIENVFNMALD